MEKSKKFEIVENLKVDFTNMTTVFVVHYQGLSVLDISKLRKSLKDSGAKITIAKNTLAKLAISGTSYENLSDYFKGPIALLFSNDPVNSAKALTEFSKNYEKVKILAGSMDNKIINSKDIDQLAKLPTLKELQGQLVSIIARPMSNLVNVIGSQSNSIIRVISEYSKETN